jgi:hypothetical protein
MAEKLFILHESEPNKGDIIFTNNVANPDMKNYIKRMHWSAKKFVSDGCRYEFVSESQLPPHLDGYDWDYSEYDGVGSGSFFRQPLNQFMLDE